MLATAEYMAACKAVQADYTHRYPDAPAAALASQVVMLQDEIATLKATAENQFSEWIRRKTNAGIVGLCQELSDEMKWWAQNPAQNNEDKTEILNTIQHLMKKIEAVEFIEDAEEEEPEEVDDLTEAEERQADYGTYCDVCCDEYRDNEILSRWE